MLTNRQGHPVFDNQNQRTVGIRGTATLENYQFLEKIRHFDRERIPERVVHARGTTSFGYFEAYGRIGDEPISAFTRAKLFQEEGKRTEVAVRFSTVIGGRDSSEAARDPRGFAVKFYTEDGNWDLVGNDLAVFFIRDAIKFSDVIHALKPDPVTMTSAWAGSARFPTSQTCAIPAGWDRSRSVGGQTVRARRRPVSPCAHRPRMPNTCPTQILRVRRLQGFGR